MIARFKLIFNTVAHLKPIQIKYQLLNKIGKKRAFHYYRRDFIKNEINYPLFSFFTPPSNSYLGNLRFSFLNIEHQFKDNVDWSYLEHGKLWNYNLQYANWLMQDSGSTKEKLTLLKSLQYSIQNTNIKPEPYPVSLRCINVIRFISKWRIEDKNIVNHLYSELNFLNNNLELHILGNHLLENLFALALGGAFFGNENLLNRAISFLKSELDEQTHDDGAHFELSPMYHQIILFRLLEFIDWYRNFNDSNRNFLFYYESLASRMLAWLNNISFQNGNIPLFNDAANGIAFTTTQLNEYAKHLDIYKADLKLSDSGYRSFKNDMYEIKIDFAQVGAKYQSGHAHADALGFILYYQGKPLFVEQGTSTYQAGEQRNLERSTKAHNCVVVREQNQSEVWGGFRTGRRATTTIIKDTDNYLVASHDGYKSLGVIHERSFELKDDKPTIKDKLSKASNGTFYLHLHHSHQYSKINEEQYLVGNDVIINFKGGCLYEILNSSQSDTFNQYKKSETLVVSFNKELTCTISFRK